jgi:hypothetical protein
MRRHRKRLPETKKVCAAIAEWLVHPVNDLDGLEAEEPLLRVEGRRAKTNHLAESHIIYLKEHQRERGRKDRVGVLFFAAGFREWRPTNQSSQMGDSPNISERSKFDCHRYADPGGRWRFMALVIHPGNQRVVPVAIGFLNNLDFDFNQLRQVKDAIISSEPEALEKLYVPSLRHVAVCSDAWQPKFCRTWSHLNRFDR